VLDRRPLPADLEGRPDVTYHACELADADAVHHAVAAITSSQGPPRHFVGVAGGANDDEVTAQNAGELPSVTAFRASIEDNLLAQYVPLLAVLPHITRTSGDRAVVLVSSINALAGFGLPGYSAAKAGLIGLMHALTGPLGAEGIRVNVVAPGTVPTKKMETFWGDTGVNALTQYSALGRVGTPDQVGAAVHSLCTDLDHVTGQVLVVDGGQLVHRPLIASE
jgi:NAD(P)-dependent dehydrogenase (short-subunit alcohol dehydrogenase family)